MIDIGVWHTAKNFFLLCLSLLILPFSTAIITTSFILCKLKSSLKSNELCRSLDPKTVLVTGVSMAKGLATARLLHCQGHRVIGADCNSLSLGRVSRAIDAFYVLSRPVHPPKHGSGQCQGPDPYVRRLSEVIEAEGVDLWISVSDVTAALQDAQAKEMIEKATKARVIQLEHEAVETLHNKATFIELAQSLHLTVPDTQTVNSSQSLIDFLAERGGLWLKPRGARYLVKPIAVNDIARFDMPILPLASEEETRSRIKSIPFGQNLSFIVQEFIQGKEFCSHALVIRGRVRAFVACPSADVLMHYVALPRDSELSKKMLVFTEKLVVSSGSAWTGHISFDFLVKSDISDKTQGSVEVFPIECNPRVHTAVLLFNQTPELVDEYLSVLGTTPGPEAVPLYPKGHEKYYWMGQDLVEQVVLPMYEAAHGRISYEDVFQSVRTFFHRTLYWRDGTYEAWDPWPWWWLYHVQWPMHFAKFMFRGRWQRLNVSTGKVFETL